MQKMVENDNKSIDESDLNPENQKIKAASNKKSTRLTLKKELEPELEIVFSFDCIDHKVKSENVMFEDLRQDY